MLPSSAWVRATHLFTGPCVPTGAAVVYCVHVDAAQPVAETAQVLHDAFGELIVEMMSSDLTMAETIAKEGPDATGAQAVVSDPSYTGLSDTASSPSNVALLITKITELGGRRGRGRMYLPGLSDPQVDDGGIINSGSLAIYQAGFEAWMVEINSSGLPLSLEHGPATEWVLVNGQPRRIPVAGAVPEPDRVEAVSVSNRAATQRRRLRR